MEGDGVAGGERDGMGRSAFVIALHAGAGCRLSRPVRDKTRALISKTLARVGRQFPADASAAEVVVAAVTCLEDSILTNAGTGSNLTFDGEVECDASVSVAADNGQKSAGAVGALRSARNPVIYAENLRQASINRGPAGLRNPVFLAGLNGGNDEVVPTSGAKQKWQEYRSQLAEVDESVGDTVGAVCWSVDGSFASASSSGGNW